jgi:hypothetical protein
VYGCVSNEEEDTYVCEASPVLGVVAKEVCDPTPARHNTPPTHHPVTWAYLRAFEEEDTCAHMRVLGMQHSSPRQETWTSRVSVSCIKVCACVRAGACTQALQVYGCVSYEEEDTHVAKQIQVLGVVFVAVCAHEHSGMPVTVAYRSLLSTHAYLRSAPKMYAK